MLVRDGAGSLIVWERVPRIYFFIFSLLSIFGLSFAVPNFTDGFVRLSNSEMKRRANVIAIVMYLRYVALLSLSSLTLGM